MENVIKTIEEKLIEEYEELKLNLRSGWIPWPLDSNSKTYSFFISRFIEYKSIEIVLGEYRFEYRELFFFRTGVFVTLEFNDNLELIEIVVEKETNAP